MARPLPTRDRLIEVVSYDPETGIFRWRPRKSLRGNNRALHAWNAKNAGKVAGKVNPDGYVEISVDGHLYYAHRLAFVYMTGEAPDYVDHEDGDQSNCRWGNLRPATISLNGANSKLRDDNKSGHKGVYWYGHISCWRAVIQKDGKQINLGYFKSKEAAVEAYQAKAAELFGAFARF